MPSLADMRTKAKEAGLMKLDKLIVNRQRIPDCEIPIPIPELCARYEKLYTGCINGTRTCRATSCRCATKWSCAARRSV